MRRVFPQSLRNMPSKRLAPLLIATFIAGTAGQTAAPAANKPEHRPAPVSVSSANYANTPYEELLALVYDKAAVNPQVRSVDKPGQAQRYVFLPGELFEMDLSYGEVCRRVSAALARKGFINAEDDKGRVMDPAKVDLLLRVSAGQRPWRNPTVRTESLTWHDGLVARPRGRTLATLGGDVAWEDRSGGDDKILGAAAQNQNAPGFGGFGTGGGRATTTGGGISTSTASSAVQAGSAANEYEATRDFYLIVVDAFSYEDVKQKGDRAKRLWTTFIAAPVQPGQKFSEVFNTMLRIATPYFGENTRGLQMFDDARAQVGTGTLKVIENDVSLPAEKK